MLEHISANLPEVEQVVRTRKDLIPDNNHEQVRKIAGAAFGRLFDTISHLPPNKMQIKSVNLRVVRGNLGEIVVDASASLAMHVFAVASEREFSSNNK